MVGPNIITFRDVTGLMVIIDKMWNIIICHYEDGPSQIVVNGREYKAHFPEAIDLERRLNPNKEDGDG